MMAFSLPDCLFSKCHIDTEDIIYILTISNFLKKKQPNM